MLRSSRHSSFYLAAAAGVIAALATALVTPTQALLWGSNSFFAVYLVLSIVRFARANAPFLQRHAESEDAPAWILFVVTLAVVGASLVSLFLLVAGEGPGSLQSIATMVSVPLGWLTVHAMAAHHYAYEYYSGASHHEEQKGGLQFPLKGQPDGLAFLYFAYVIGMTAQVADVAVTSRRMQQLVLLHGIFSFFFNTVIVAATVNVVVSL
ncbi:DUF1345 domain-containing protein [Devosia sp. SD17-2]|uniref:DUF1345 domain-containing protein n=1 Tax=Devosia sp. SD17-2 TaxID=2976459 RepID=UPI0023D841A7|nr:DUF1345 domain-containing protein [Devosia sp. SD17-2]WEJ35120.1 DUF1345 domain-containing protein [Devosia sp. SD17-2]